MTGGDVQEENKIDDALAAEAEALDGYFSDAPLDPKPKYPPLNESMDTAIVITNLPKVKADKVEKLQKVILKLVSKIGPLRNVGEEFTGLLLPTNDEQATLGFCFVDYQLVEHARNAVAVLQGYMFDKNHSLAVCLFHRAEQLEQINTGEFQAPEPVPFQEKPNPTVWLQDSNQRDEFVMRYGKETVVKWFDGRTEPTVDYDGEREKDAGVAWCENYVHFSPAGSYLATLVPQKGVILWSGQDYQKTARFPARTYGMCCLGMVG
jgi:translation initiation factor 3 subunit B